jgi:hypothetical protein
MFSSLVSPFHLRSASMELQHKKYGGNSSYSAILLCFLFLTFFLSFLGKKSMRDRTYIIIYEVYQAPCRFLNILYIHCTRATGSGSGGGGWKPIRGKTNDLITYTDTEHSRIALLFCLLACIHWTIDDKLSVVYLSAI